MQCIEIVFVSLTQTYLVTGGYNTVSGEFDSTELLHKDASQWVYAGPLPSKRKQLKGATLSDKLIMTGYMVLMMMYRYLNLLTIARWRERRKLFR